MDEATGFFKYDDIDYNKDSGGFDDSGDDQEGDGDGINNFEEVGDSGFEDNEGKSGGGDDKDEGDDDNDNDKIAENDEDADDQEQSCTETPLYSSSQISCDEFNSIFLALMQAQFFFISS